MEPPFTSSLSEPPVSAPLAREEIVTIVLQTMRTCNLARDAEAQLQIAPDAAIFGPGSPLDSLGLVALVLDLEDELAGRGCQVALSDERAMSQKRSPFRTVNSLVDYISMILN
jgi:acyl carrier protein